MSIILGSKAKETWRSLRDGYIRYKKHVKGQSGIGRKYCYFTWSSQLAFLDEALQLRPTRTKPTSLQSGSELPQSPTMLRNGDASEPQQSSLTLDLPHSLAPSQSSSQSGPSWAGPSPPSQTPDFNSPTQSLLIPDSNSPSSLSSLLLQKFVEAENKRRAEYDAIDLLFMSYADTFRKLSLRKQAELKVRLAKLFADAELSEMNNDFPMHEPQPSSPIIHSVMLEELTQQNFVIEDLKHECESD